MVIVGIRIRDKENCFKHLGLYSGYHLFVVLTPNINAIYLHQSVILLEPSIISWRPWLYSADILSWFAFFLIQIESISNILLTFDNATLSWCMSMLLSHFFFFFLFFLSKSFNFRVSQLFVVCYLFHSH